MLQQNYTPCLVVSALLRICNVLLGFFWLLQHTEMMISEYSFAAAYWKMKTLKARRGAP